jgi:hypothetical protein
MVNLSYELFGVILILVSGVSIFIGVLISDMNLKKTSRLISRLEWELKCYQLDVERLQNVIKDLRAKSEDASSRQ